jgi:hypothetical protein
MINEHDIKDMYALYELPKGSKFKLTPEEGVDVPPDHLQYSLEEVYIFDHIDGMYSYCLDSKGALHHFAAWTKVIKLGEQA